MRLVLRSLFASVIAGLLAQTSFGQTSDNWTESYDRLLKKYVTPAGVKYAAWKNNASDLKELQGVVDGIGSASVNSLGKNDQLAFYINAYNAWILHEALGKYPTKSVKDVLYTFFTSKRIRVAGEQMSFKRLEDDIIRAKFGEPGIHFALNCASRSCPPLDREPFIAAKLDGQMEKLARAYINSEKGVIHNEASKSAQLSKILDWYKDDFTKAGGVIEFINKRRASPIAKDAKISYQEYDWALNETK